MNAFAFLLRSYFLNQDQITKVIRESQLQVTLCSIIY